LAAEALGPDRVLAVTGDSPSLSVDDLEDARRVARHCGVRHQVVQTNELELEPYRANTGDRCFHCRSELFRVLAAIARGSDLGTVTYGAIVDDDPSDRPGMRAADELGVVAPLLEAGFDKADVRQVAADEGLPVRDKPAAACLSSRIPVGTPVTIERLGQVERAEAALRRLGFSTLRVRHHGQVARIETDEAGFAMLSDSAVRSAVTQAVLDAGFRHVALDLAGYRGAGRETAPARDGGQ
jgi:uncharacterized protein